MDSTYFRIIELIDLYVNGNISPEERDELALWQQKYPQIDKWLERGEGLDVENRYEFYRSNAVLSDWQIILNKRSEPLSTRKRFRWGVAATILLSFSIGMITLENTNLQMFINSLFEQKETVISPGNEKAILTLSDGTTVLLGEQGQQKLTDGGVALHVVNNHLEYSDLASKEVYQHKLKIPLGGTFQIQLADGTKVWLNADSELEYPSAFPASERYVKVVGEAFFEIAKDPLKPFKVEVNGTLIEALGTSFNINTHRFDEKVKTILTEGKIKVTDQREVAIIESGYAVISGAGAVKVQKADVEEALSWKEGYFYFNNKSLHEICSEISRWYDVGFQIDKNIAKDKYRGGIKRTESIEAVCQVLTDLTGYNIEMKNRTLTIK